MKLDIDSPAARLRLALLHLTNLIVLLAQHDRAHPARKKALAYEVKAQRDVLIKALEEAL